MTRAGSRFRQSEVDLATDDGAERVWQTTDVRAASARCRLHTSGCRTPNRSVMPAPTRGGRRPPAESAPQARPSRPVELLSVGIRSAGTSERRADMSQPESPSGVSPATPRVAGSRVRGISEANRAGAVAGRTAAYAALTCAALVAVAIVVGVIWLSV
jgi:hypothetical protein